ncbi:hypothetical protein [Streptomyces coeruleorubidus]|uniref:hypothetical protein n=1 Tax=Streptomyces coeruleorubidus TaxID=116188 RepID=UPI0033B0C7AD
MPHLTHQVDTADGPIFHLEISQNQFLSIDIRRERDVFSWTAACTAKDFLRLGREKNGTVELIVDGTRLSGKTSEVLAKVLEIPDEIVNETCDFVRFNWADSSLIFQAFSTGEAQSEERRLLVTAIGRGMQLPKLRPLIDKTGTGAVIDEIDSHLAFSMMVNPQ